MKHPARRRRPCLRTRSGESAACAAEDLSHHACEQPGVDLDQIDWVAVAARDFRRADVKEGKQAEFLVHEFFPWHLVTRIGAYSLSIRSKALVVLQAATQRPTVEVRPEWYY